MRDLFVLKPQTDTFDHLQLSRSEFPLSEAHVLHLTLGGIMFGGTPDRSNVHMIGPKTGSRNLMWLSLCQPYHALPGAAQPWLALPALPRRAQPGLAGPALPILALPVPSQAPSCQPRLALRA